MLHDFLSAHREPLIERCRRKVAQRHAPQPTDAELHFGIPLFLDQLITTLKMEQTAEPADDANATEIGRSAGRHGRELLQHGFTVEQVVHDYGDLCQAVTGLAIELEAPINTEEFRTLNRCLDNAIADAVLSFTQGRQLATAGRDSKAVNQRLSALTRELRSHIDIAILAVGAIRTGHVGLSGSTAGMLDSSLLAMRALVDKTSAE